MGRFYVLHFAEKFRTPYSGNSGQLDHYVEAPYKRVIPNCPGLPISIPLPMLNTGLDELDVSYFALLLRKIPFK